MSLFSRSLFSLSSFRPLLTPPPASSSFLPLSSLPLSPFFSSPLLSSSSRFLSGEEGGKGEGEEEGDEIREYFYYVSDQGNLYVINKEEKKMPWGPAHLRDKQFLNFFFKRIENNTTEWHSNIFPYLSMCMGEYNFVRAADKPIVFHTLTTFEGFQKDYQEEKRVRRRKRKEEMEGGEWVLVYGATLYVPFSPEKIVVSDEGRLYHPYPPYNPQKENKEEGKEKGEQEGEKEEWGLLRVSVAEQLAEGLGVGEEGGWVLEWEGKEIPLRRYEDVV